MAPRDAQVSNSQCRNTRQSGFTLLELVIVVAVIVIMTALGTIAIGRSDVNSMRANALEVQALFDRARQTALAERSWTCVVVSPSSGTFKLYLQPSAPTSSPALNSIAATVVLRQGMGLPVRYGISIAGEPLSAYFNQSVSSGFPYILNNDYIGAVSKDVRVWYDGFGHPNVTPLAAGGWPGGGGTDRSYGFVTISSSSGGLAIQVMVYAFSGTTGLRWIKR